MTHVALITTTIHVPHVLTTYVEHAPEDVTLDVIVAGDVNTPLVAEDLVRSVGGTYLDYYGEHATRWVTNETVGLRSIQRRNVALLHALTLGPDYVITVDDDNYALDAASFVEDFVDGFESALTSVRTSTRWFDPGSLLRPPTVHRGFPLDQRHGRAHAEHVVDGLCEVGVVAGLTIGDPDVDAVERLVNRPHVQWWGAGHVLALDTWAPFNTQNTAYAWDVAPLMQCLVGVGRYDDILMSYVARRVLDDLGLHVRYGLPLVEQRRNEHDVLRDLEQELLGYRLTPTVTSQLRDFCTSGDSVIDRLAEVYAYLTPWLPESTNRANEAWLEDVRTAVEEGERVRAA